MKARILIVEDDEPTRCSFLYLLRYANHHVREAVDGEMALELLAAEHFDVVITDIIMGQVDGMQVLHVARQQPYHPEVIVLTGHGTFETAVQAVREGAFDYLVKPCNNDQLRATVTRALQRHRSEQQVRLAAHNLISALYGEGEDGDLLPPNTDQPAIYADHEAPITVGELVIGASRRDVFFAGEVVHLTHTEYMLLDYLARHAGQLCTSPAIIRVTHGIDAQEAEAQALVKPHIHNLRKKLHPAYFATERGKGYRLVIPGDEDDCQ